MDTLHSYIQTMGFQTYDVQNQDIGYVIPQDQRCGIYVLHMADTTYYVGQAKDVARRYREHCRNYSAITFVSFKRVPQKHLDNEEERIIRTLELHGFRLLNILHTSITHRSTDFDLLVPPDQQKRWLEENNISWVYTGEDRLDNNQVEQRLKYRQKFEKFQRAPHYQAVVSILKQYVQACIPAFKSTQFEYWSVSCLPATFNHARYATVNINTMETLVIGKSGWAFVNVARTPFRKIYSQHGRFARMYPGTILRNTNYDAPGFDQIGIDMASLTQTLRVLQEPAVILAARFLNVQLMRKRRVLFARYHCFDLADELVSE